MKFKVASISSVKSSKRKRRLRCLLPIFAASLIISILYLYSYYTNYPNPIDSLSTVIIIGNDETKVISSSPSNTQQYGKPTIVTDQHIDGKVLDTVAAYHSSLSNTPQYIKPIIVAKKHIGRKVDTVETSLSSSSNTPQHGQPTDSEKHIDNTADKLDMNPKASDYLPLNGPLSKRPTSTLHPESLNPKRTYNTETPNLPPCHREDDKVVSIYIESQGRMDGFFIKGFPSVNSTSCNLHCKNSGGLCPPKLAGFICPVLASKIGGHSPPVPNPPKMVGITHRYWRYNNSMQICAYVNYIRIPLINNNNKNVGYIPKIKKKMLKMSVQKYESSVTHDVIQAGSEKAQ